MSKKKVLFVFLLSIILILTACNIQNTNGNQQSTPKETSNSNLDQSKTNKENKENNENKEIKDEPEDQVSTKDITFKVEGQLNVQPGSIYTSKDQNFYMYLLPGYGANYDSVKEIDTIWNMDSDQESITIKNFHKEDQQPLVDEASKELKARFKKVEEDYSKRNNKFYHNAVILQGYNENEKNIVIVLPINGNMFEITISQPADMKSNEHLFAMIETVTVK